MRVTAIAVHVAVLLLFGVLVPLVKGIELLHVLLLLPYSLLGLFWVSLRSVQVGFTDPISLRGLFRATLEGWAAGAAVLLLALVTLSVEADQRVVVPGALFLSLLVFSLLACLLTGAMGVRAARLTRHPAAAIQGMRLGLLVLLVLLLGAPRLLSEESTMLLLAALSPEGVAQLTMALIPLMTLATVYLLQDARARYTD